jgi:hypothetical protein
MSDSSISSSSERASARLFLAKGTIFVVLFYGFAMLASAVFARVVDWRAYQDPRARLFWDTETNQADVIFLGDSVFTSTFVNAPEDGFSSVVQQMTGKRVFNGALDGADPPDFLRAAQLLVSNGTRNSIVILDVMPNRALAFQQEPTAGNYPGQFERVVGDDVVTRVLVKLRQPLIILDPDILMNCLQKKSYYESGHDQVWFRDGDLARRRFQVFEQQVPTASSRPFDWIERVDAILRQNGDRLVVFISPLNNDLIDAYASEEKAAQYHALYSAEHARLVDYLQHADIFYIDGTGKFDSDSFADMVHVNKRGNRRFAELIAGYLQSNPNAQIKSSSNASASRQTF